MENLKVGDMLYFQEVFYGTPRLLSYRIAKVTPKQYVLANGTRVKREDLTEIGSYSNQYVIKPDESFMAKIYAEYERVNAKEAVKKLLEKINNGELFQKQYESIVEFCKQFEEK